MNHYDARKIKGSLIDDETAETSDIGFAAYLLTCGAVIQDASARLAITGGRLTKWKLKHPAMKLVVHQFHETIRLCPSKLLQNRDYLKSNFTVLPK